MINYSNALGWDTVGPVTDIVPRNDVHPHVHGVSCPCRPEVDENMVVIHQSFDRREDYEEKRRKPS